MQGHVVERRHIGVPAAAGPWCCGTRSHTRLRVHANFNIPPFRTTRVSPRGPWRHEMLHAQLLYFGVQGGLETSTHSGSGVAMMVMPEPVIETPMSRKVSCHWRTNSHSLSTPLTKDHTLRR